MENLYDTYRPDGFGTVTPYVFAKNPSGLIDFLVKGLKGIEIQRTTDPGSGAILNCILKLGHSCLMVSQSRPPFSDMKSSFYLYVNNVETMHRHALKAEGVEVMPPADMDYEDRQSGIQDPEGNYWWISTRLVEKDYSE